MVTPTPSSHVVSIVDLFLLTGRQAKQRTESATCAHNSQGGSGSSASGISRSHGDRVCVRDRHRGRCVDEVTARAATAAGS